VRAHFPALCFIVFGRYIEEADGVPMDASQSDAILAHLYEQANHPEYNFTYFYSPGDMTFWDNRACMHRALQDFGPHERSMRRVTIQGGVPFFGPLATTAKWQPRVASGVSKL
jgi:alpha-ketoglutarate-dependent taurine dioxygenase